MLSAKSEIVLHIGRTIKTMLADTYYRTLRIIASLRIIEPKRIIEPLRVIEHRCVLSNLLAKFEDLFILFGYRANKHTMSQERRFNVDATS